MLLGMSVDMQHKLEENSYSNAMMKEMVLAEMQGMIVTMMILLVPMRMK